MSPTHLTKSFIDFLSLSEGTCLEPVPSCALRLSSKEVSELHRHGADNIRPQLKFLLTPLAFRSALVCMTERDLPSLPVLVHVVKHVPKRLLITRGPHPKPYQLFHLPPFRCWQPAWVGPCVIVPEQIFIDHRWHDPGQGDAKSPIRRRSDVLVYLKLRSPLRECGSHRRPACSTGGFFRLCVRPVILEPLLYGVCQTDGLSTEVNPRQGVFAFEVFNGHFGSLWHC